MIMSADSHNMRSHRPRENVWRQRHSHDAVHGRKERAGLKHKNVENTTHTHDEEPRNQGSTVCMHLHLRPI